MENLSIRPRRLRKTPGIRSIVSETTLNSSQLITPHFVVESDSDRGEIKGLAGYRRLNVKELCGQIEADLGLGLKSHLLFGVPREKDTRHQDINGPVAVAARELKKVFGNDIVLMSDVCLCSYLSHGHCGAVQGNQIVNDPSVALLSRMAVIHAEAGVDVVAPSDMMDGRVGAIRSALDSAGLIDTSIMSYTAKYSSGYYGPFREAANSAPAFGDRASYQMDFRNSREALRELELDLQEGADFVLVKPALAYLDIIHQFRQVSPVPVVAYSVSGEYAMVEALANAGLGDADRLHLENHYSIRRAGADLIISYASRRIAKKI